MALANSRGARTRSRAQIWKVAALLLFPVVVLMALAAKASAELEQPAQETSISGR